MDNVSFVEAWKLWFSGTLVHDSVLWGMSILWWGRIGKLIQFVAALTIIAEIIGPERLRKFGNSLHGTFTLAKAMTLLRDALEFAMTFWQYMIAPKNKEDQVLEEASRFKTSNVNVIVMIIMIVAGLYLSFSYLRWWLALIVGVVVMGLTGFAAPIITLTIVLIFTFIGAFIDIVIIEPFAWMIERQHLDKWVKIIAALLFVIGFHFDLLAS